MHGRPDPKLFPYADHVLDRIEAEREPAEALREAARAGEALVLDFHPHDDGSGWCAAIRLERDGTDVVHLRGIVREREECAPMGQVLAGLLKDRHRLLAAPRIFVDGAPLFV